MRNLLKLFVLCILLLCTACTTIQPTFTEKIEKEDDMSILYKEMLNVDRVMTELHLILKELQKNDELDGAIEMMEIAKKEANDILTNIQEITTENKALASFQLAYEQALQQYIDGLEQQLTGMKNWNGKLTTEGYKQTETAKTKLNTIREQIEFLFPNTEFSK